MRILHVLSSIDPKAGGVAKAVEIAVGALNAAGFVNEIACFDDPNAVFLQQSSFNIFALGPANNPYSYNSKYYQWALQNFQNYDNIIIHGLWQYSSFGTWRFWKKTNSKAKLWVMPHGMLDPYFQKAKSRRLKAIRNWIFWKLFENKVVNKSNGLLFTCEDEKLLAKTTFTPYKPGQEHIVGLGIAAVPIKTNSFQEAFQEHCPLKEHERFFLFLGRIDPKKGVDLLVAAYKKIDDVNKPALVIAGPGLDSAYGKLIAEQAKGDSNIHFPGMLQGDSKWGAFYSCEAFVLTSHQENFGIAVVEAMACGKPVLISNQINIWREIANGGGGLVEEDTEAGAFKLLTDWSKMSTSEQTQMGQKAYLTYVDTFTTKTFADNLMEVFKK